MTIDLPLAPSAAASAADAALWHVRLLGGFELDDGRQCLTRLRSRAAMVLVARLAMQPARVHPREELATLLWPDADDATARNRLRQTLSLLRDVLEPPGAPAALLADRRGIKALPGALWCDALAFEQALRARQHELALALYRGDLLPGFYDEWVVDERDRLLALRDRLGEAGDGAPGDAAARAAPRQPQRVQDDGEAASAPQPPRERAARPGGPRLPQYLTGLVGADDRLQRLGALLAAQRLVVLLGPGGCGKTRLAVEAARLAQAAAGGFEWAAFVSLVGAVGAAELLDRLLLALRAQAAGDAFEQAVSVLDGRRVLVVLDNAEQLDDAAVATIARLAEQLPRAHWLVTSRRSLGIDGEHGVALEGLALPELEDALDAVAANPAVRLYVDRARAHRAEFAVNAGNRGALVALVRWLEGLPLAIELAASHARTLGPAELLALLRHAREQPAEPAASLAFLARRGARSGSDARHASMLAVTAWSWQLLRAPLQHLLGRISLLPAGATLHAAAALAQGADAAGARTNLVRAQAELDELVAHSVLRIGAGQDGQMRYTPYEPVREYALAMAGDGAERRAGRAAVLAWLQRWAAQLPATPPLASVRDELPNVMQALAQAPADGHADAAVALVLQLQSSWGEIALPSGVLQVLSALLATPGLDAALAAGGHALAGIACQEAGQAAAARRHLDAALALPLADPARQADVLSRAARLRWRLDRDATGARELIGRALPLARSAGRPNTEAALLSLQAHLLTVVDHQHQRARELAAQALALWRESGNRHLVNAGRFNVAVNSARAGGAPEVMAGVLAELQALADEGRALADWDLACGALDALGTTLLGLRRWPAAARALHDSLAVAWDASQRLGVVYALWNIAPVLARLGQGELAARTMGAAQAQWEQRFGALDASDRRDLRRMRRFARALLGPRAAREAWSAGAAAGLAPAVHAVLAWVPPRREGC